MAGQLYYGDNLEVLRRHIPEESVDLVYLDPPFNSNRAYNMLFAEQDGTRAAAQIRAFEDTWEWNTAASKSFNEVVTGDEEGPARALQAFKDLLGETDMLAYISMMAPRLIELRNVLKPTGSLYLHCDPNASHYLKLLLDAVFGPANFRSEIVWKRSSAHAGSRRYSPVHDTILFYSKTDTYTWFQLYQPLPQETADAWYNNVEESTGRRYNRADLTAAGVRSGSSGKAWRGVDPTVKGRHWAIPRSVEALGADLEGMDTMEALDALDAGGRIHWPQKTGGMPMLKRYLDESKGVPALDVITDIAPLNNVDAERLGYPTQKPVALLERLILASTRKGDWVLDPFCGCGTTIDAAERLQRNWFGIDITHLAIGLVKSRLMDAHPDIKIETPIGEPTTLQDAAQLAAEDQYQFQVWALGLVGARPTELKKGADKGIDGRKRFLEHHAAKKAKQIVFSVKAGHVTVSHLRDLRGVVERENAEIGVLICMEQPTSAMKKEAATGGFYKSLPTGTSHPKLQILTIEDLLSGKGIDYPVYGAVPSVKRMPQAKAAPGKTEPMPWYQEPAKKGRGGKRGRRPPRRR